MVKRKSKKKVEVPLKMGQQKVTIDDEAIYYIVNNYLQEKTKTSGLSVLVGISSETVEDVLRLFIDWAALRGYIEDGVLTIGEEEVD